MFDCVKLNVNRPPGILSGIKVDSSRTNHQAAEPDKFVRQKNSYNDAKKFAFLGGTGLLIAFYISKGKYTEVKKLAKHIDFQPAQTIEEAVKYGKKHLGIKDYSGFTLKDIDVINWINEGLVNVSNRFKGKLRMPKNIDYGELEDLEVAMVTSKTKLTFNKKLFDEPDKLIEGLLDDVNLTVEFKKNSEGYWSVSADSILNKNSVLELLIQFEKYKKGNFSFNEKLDFASSLSVLKERINLFNNVPLDAIEQMLEDSEVIKICRDNNILTDLAKIKQLSDDEQWEMIRNIIAKGGKYVEHFDIKSRSAFFDIYHEMGHIQDMVPRCGTTSYYNFDYSKYSEALKSWVDNKENIQNANRVSRYATYGPGEFVAETFANMIECNELHEEVLALYKKLKGPVVAGY